MKNWKKYASLLLALVLCLSLTACGGDVDTAPATIDGLVIDDSVEYDYDIFLGTWLAEDDSVLAVEVFDDDELAHFTLSDADDDWIASGLFQYVEEYGYVYAYNDYDGIAYQCRFGENDTLYIDTFGTFTKVSDDVPVKTADDKVDFSMLVGIWNLDGEPNATKTIEFTYGSWILWEQDDVGDWCMMDSGSLNKTGDDAYEAFSERYDQVHYMYLIEDNEMQWDGDDYEKSE